MFEADGSRSEGFRMKVLPATSAIGNIHIGTMAGKLNGVMPATTPERLADRPAIDIGADILAELALQELRRAAGEFDHFEAAGELALGVGEDLAVLGGDHGDDLVGVALRRAA